ncbi:2Fe-2S iron-sulfur cluster-binding protein [Streptomyces sp. NPDC028635]|uniref:2Fe-2S iron-sulfur cluster-binding protein n=1 Tax=Streptomyces sp. NPDC028635 TaxID=3154800 RepID=UPI0033FD8AA0
MTDDQHAEGTPQGGSRWDPLPQGDYDDGATAFVKLPEGGIDALLSGDSPLAAPGHGYVPPQITVAPATTAGTDPAATGTWSMPVDGVQWGAPASGDAAQAGTDDRFAYQPGATGQWNFTEHTDTDAYGTGGAPAEPESAPSSAPGHDVTGQWSIPVAGGDLPDESGEYTTSSLVEQWGGTPPATLPGGAAAPWATGAQGHPWDSPQPPEPGAHGEQHADTAHAGEHAVPGHTGSHDAPPHAGHFAGHGDDYAVGPVDAPVTGPLPAAAHPAQAPEAAPEAPGAESAADEPRGELSTPSTRDAQGAADAQAADAQAADAQDAGAQDVDDAQGAPGAHEESGAVDTGAVDIDAVDADADAAPTAVTAPEPQAEEASEQESPEAAASRADTEEPTAAEPSEPPAHDAPGLGEFAQGDRPHDAPPPPHDEHPLASYVLRVNGADRPVGDAWIGESLLYVLRERLGLAGAKDGCSQGECGACNVQVDGRLVASCLVPAVTAAGSEVRTVEGLAADGQPSDVQRALARCGAVQCGFCVPGMAMTLHDLLEGNPAPTEMEARQALCGNLCRCSGYRGVLQAVQDVVTEREALRTGDGETDGDEARIPHQAGPGAGGVHPSAFEAGGFESPAAYEDPAAPHGHDQQPYGQGEDGGQA